MWAGKLSIRPPPTVVATCFVVSIPPPPSGGLGLVAVLSMVPGLLETVVRGDEGPNNVPRAA